MCESLTLTSSLSLYLVARGVVGPAGARVDGGEEAGELEP